MRIRSRIVVIVRVALCRCRALFRRVVVTLLLLLLLLLLLMMMMMIL
jgi:hypothetical protein